MHMANQSRSDIAHLLRRTGFGPTAAEVDAALTKGYDTVVTELLDFAGSDPVDSTAPPAFAPYEPLGQKNLTPEERQAINKRRGDDLRALQTWWLTRMADTAHPLREKLTFFWHGHFATSYEKVRRPDLMLRQNEIFRHMGTGRFEDLTQTVAKDPAMLIWLDAASDKKAHPNENFSRELMELFTLGLGAYTEDDVREAARAFTGWYVNPKEEAFALQPKQHDDGAKTVLGQTGPWGGEEVIHIVVANPACAPFITARLWSHLAYPVVVDDPVVRALAPTLAGGDVKALLGAILHHEQFRSDRAKAGLVKQPVEWVLGALRALGLPAGDPHVLGALRQLGQVPLEPPNVGGWPQNEYWLTTASSLARLTLASALANLADLSAVAAVAPGDRPDLIAHQLSVTWSESTFRGLAQATADPKELVTLALVSPEFVLA
ncbi:MAG: DUF1800 domain-containing protein [Acidimicrobiales bacterium]